MIRRISVMILIFGFYLGLQDGYLALWKNSCSEPLQVYPFHISIYPKMDKELLEKGIPIRSESEFSKCIEDFTS